MTRFILTRALAVLVAGSMVATVQAGGPGKGGGSKPSGGGGQSSSVGKVGGSVQGKVSGGQSQGGSQGKASGSQSGASKPWQNGPKVTTPTKFNGNKTFVKDYHKIHGTSFKHGTCYKGNHHSHWTYFCYSNHYGCNCYWCPYTSCYYYWYEPGLCYYPINYFQYAPVVAVAPVTVAPVAAAPVVAAAPIASTSSYTVPVTVQVTSQVSQVAIVANGVGGPVGPGAPPQLP